MIYGTADLPLAGLLESFGIDVKLRNCGNSQDKGGKEVTAPLSSVDLGAALKDGDTGLMILRLIEAGSAQIAGLSAGDQVIAIDGLRLNLGQVEKKLLRASPGDVWQVHAFRRDELHHFDIQLQAATQNTFVLKAGDQPQSKRLAWLGS
jgi:predicted metalloprotease with PDZ domain